MRRATTLRATALLAAACGLLACDTGSERVRTAPGSPAATLESGDESVAFAPAGEFADGDLMELEEEVLEDAPFEGAGTIGLGGGAGGSFTGRGGRRARGMPRSAPEVSPDSREPVIADGKSGARAKAPAKTWKRAQLVPNSTRLSVGEKDELPIVGMQVQVRVDGFRARVVLDCLYRNDRDKQLEGRFQLRLPDEASPYYFAFGETVKQLADVQAVFLPEGVTASVGTSLAEIRSRRRETWTAPKEARMVPRQKAAHAYVETTRRRIDPALMEWSGAGVFEARVFPLAPAKLHRVVVGYDVNLVPIGDGLEYRLDLPEGLPALTLDVDVARHPDAAYSFEANGGTRTSTSLETGMHHFRTTDTRTRFVKVRAEGAPASLLTGSDAETGEHFAASFRPDFPATPQRGSQRAVFVLDVSASSNPERFNVWLELLDEVLARNEDSLREFAVLCFNVERFWWREGFTANTAANRTAVGAFARDLALEGATDLAGALAETAAPPWIDIARETHDVFLLSDGAATWKTRDVHEIIGRFLGRHAGALFAYKTGFTGTDRRALDFLTRETGGAVFSVVGEDEIATAAVAHRARPWRLAGVTLEGGSDLLLAGRPRALFPGQTLYLAGRGTPAPGAPVVLTFEQGNERNEIRVRLPAATPSELAPRVYGQIATTQLEEFTHATEDASEAYARHFRVVGSTCSLLMLDSKEDYARFGIHDGDEAKMAAQVRATPAAAEVRRVVQARMTAAYDPRAAFLSELDRLARAPGVEFQGLDALRKLVADLPRTSFDVRTPRLRCADHTWDGVPGSVQELLSARTAHYDAMVAEALRLRAAERDGDAVRALSTLVEERPGDVALLRDVAFTLMDWRLEGEAYGLLRRAADARPYEPETYRMLAECLDAMGHTDLALLYYEICMAGTWNGRFGEFKRIAGLDYVRFLRRTTVLGDSSAMGLFRPLRLEALSKDFAPPRADVAVTVTWNTDRTDVDLHVTDPSGETCLYSHPRTKAGGVISSDVTQGYGPEMFLLAEAPKGAYHVQVHYFASDRLRTKLRTRVFATVVRNWGTPQETVTRKAVTLEGGQQMHTVARFTID